MARGYEEFPQHFPRPGWVEHEPEQIWQATLSACRQALRRTGRSVTAIGITNQRETAVLWDRSSLAAPRRAVVWQDRRSAAICDRLRDAGHEDRVRELTGLRFDPYFTGTKLRLAGRERPAVVGRRHRRLGRRRHRRLLPGGPADRRRPARHRRVQRLAHPALRPRAPATGPTSCASCFGVPRAALPEVVPSYGEVGRTSPAAFLGLDLPIAGIAGDQQAALFGQACFAEGESKCTYGTGSFVLVNTGTDARCARTPGCSRRSRGWPRPAR